MRFPVGPQRHVFPKTVDHDAHIFIMETQLDHLFVPSEHPEGLSGIARQIKTAEFFPAFSFYAEQPDMQHLVHAEMFQDAGIHIITDQIIILIVPGQRPGAHLIVFSPFFQPDLLGNGPFEIPELNLPVFCNCCVQLIYIIVDALVHRLDTVSYYDLSLKVSCLVSVCQSFDFLYECI